MSVPIDELEPSTTRNNRRQQNAAPDGWQGNIFPDSLPEWNPHLHFRISQVSHPPGTCPMTRSFAVNKHKGLHLCRVIRWKITNWRKRFGKWIIAWKSTVDTVTEIRYVGPGNDLAIQLVDLIWSIQGSPSRPSAHIKTSLLLNVPWSQHEEIGGKLQRIV